MRISNADKQFLADFIELELKPNKHGYLLAVKPHPKLGLPETMLTIWDPLNIHKDFTEVWNMLGKEVQFKVPFVQWGIDFTTYVGIAEWTSLLLNDLPTVCTSTIKILRELIPNDKIMQEVLAARHAVKKANETVKKINEAQEKTKDSKLIFGPTYLNKKEE